jgi:hypothetical protein
MDHAMVSEAMVRLLRELLYGTPKGGGSVVLNGGDVGLLRTLDATPAVIASRSSPGGASIAAHMLHVQYGLALLNKSRRDGSNAYDDPKWDTAWKTREVTEAEWRDIRDVLRAEGDQWLDNLARTASVSVADLAGTMGSIAHVAYHFGAIRQVDESLRGPTRGTFAPPG